MWNKANPSRVACVGSVLAHLRRPSPCLAATAGRDELRHDRLDAIGGDGEAHAIGGRIKLGIDSSERGNTDHVALQVDQGSSTITPINRGIGLNRILDGRSALPFGDASFARAITRAAA
jgi:hypothetical protein